MGLFQKIFGEAEKMAVEIGVKFKAPRTCGKQRCPQNDDVEGKRTDVYIPFLESIIMGLREYFSKDIFDVFQFGVITALVSELEPPTSIL